MRRLQDYRRLHLTQGIGVILLSSFLFGFMAVSVRIAAREMGAMQIAFFRFIGSLGVMLVATRGEGLRPSGDNLRPLVLRGLIGGSAICLYFIGIRGAGAGPATLLQNTYPVFAALIASTVLGEPFSPRLALALALNLSGAAIVIGVGSGLHLDSAHRLGALSALSAAVLSGGAITAARHLRSRESAAVITTYFMIVGSVITAPSLLADIPPLSRPLALALASVVLTSVGGQWLLHHGLGFTSAVRGSLAAATSVFTASAVAALALDEPLSPRALAGGAFMIVAVGLAASAQPRESHETTGESEPGDAAIEPRASSRSGR
jgi:drug/metabolite transporter (DMT)-like permease